MARVVTLIRSRFHPDGEEFCAQISTPRLVQTDVANVVRVRRADVEAFVEKTLRRIGVGIDHNRRIMNLAGTRANGSARVRNLRSCQGTRQREHERKSASHSWGLRQRLRTGGDCIAREEANKRHYSSAESACCTQLSNGWSVSITVLASVIASKRDFTSR